MELQNRVKFPATASCLDKDGYITEEFIDYQLARVRGGCGLNTPEDCRVHARTASSHNLGIWNDTFIPGMKQLSEAIHAEGGKICVQFDKGGLANWLVAPEKPVFIPSDITFYSRDFKGVDKAMIHEVAESYGSAAARAAKIPLKI